MKINIAKIERERIRQNLTITALASQANISKQVYWSFIKRGSTRLQTLEKIAKALDFDPKDLLI